MTRAELRAIILAHPLDAPKTLGERIGLSAHQVSYARSDLIREGKLQPIKPANVPITAAERLEIVEMRRAGMTQPQIRERTGRGMGSIFEILQLAIKAGVLDPIKRAKPPVDTYRGGLGDEPAPAPRARQAKEPPCRWALSLMARGMSEIKAREQARLDRHKRKLEPWEGAGPFHS